MVVSGNCNGASSLCLRDTPPYLNSLKLVIPTGFEPVADSFRDRLLDR